MVRQVGVCGSSQATRTKPLSDEAARLLVKILRSSRFTLRSPLYPTVADWKDHQPAIIASSTMASDTVLSSSLSNVPIFELTVMPDLAVDCIFRYIDRVCKFFLHKSSLLM